jgi:hypothetical protein
MPAREAALHAAVHRLAAAINQGDSKELRDALAIEVEFDTQSMLEPIFGRDEVLTYIATLLATARAEQRPLTAAPAALRVGDADQNGVLLGRAGTPEAFWAPTLGAAGKIAQIFGYTRVPPPSQARLVQNAEAEQVVASAPVSLARRAPTSRQQPGPIRFHGFCVSEHVASSWLRPRLAELTRRFPGSEAHVHLHDPRRASPEEVGAYMSQATRFGLSSYPVICVERGGRVLRDGQAEQQLPALIRDVAQLLRAGR